MRKLEDIRTNRNIDEEIEIERDNMEFMFQEDEDEWDDFRSVFVNNRAGNNYSINKQSTVSKSQWRR